jgi:hypothetical protein
MSDKVVSLFAKREEKKGKTAEEGMKDIKEANDELEAEMTFEEIMKANEAKKKKAAEERLKANKGVLRSYRIKP